MHISKIYLLLTQPVGITGRENLRSRGDTVGAICASISSILRKSEDLCFQITWMEEACSRRVWSLFSF